MEEKQFIHDIVAEKADIIAGINRAVWDYAEFGYQEAVSLSLEFWPSMMLYRI